MFNERTAIGLDVHARSIRAAALDTVTGELVQARLPGSTDAALAWVAGIADRLGPVGVVYEAGPTGFGLARSLSTAGIPCTVAAPSKIVRPSGDRVKTDARDAILLARLLRMDELTAVRVPTIAEEAARDLVRARDDVRTDLMAARHRLSKLLLRHGFVYDGRAWTGAHDAWLRAARREGLAAAGPGTLAAFDAAYDTVTMTLARRERLDRDITAMAADSQFTAVTRRLCCLRGINTLTGFGLAVELGDWDRFTGRSIAAYLGLVPSEHSSGQSRSLGAITKTGNTHARRLLIEAAWHHKPRYTPGKTMTDRWAAAPAEAAARGGAGNRRLHHRWQVLAGHRKKHTVANTAIARELAGWCWSLAVMD
ncbi:IS110 family transposase [Agromyces archimandritae]|uniref:IS110 family transposase n=1 Tax=Agromyces archimandritae TaxID=2781962 RepID=A0A975FJQ6_9MICO|nr:IS110 family transposase [Agromyces archimandritae]QTX03765.1 IS110 family transposase [Agromyces archimandritae]